MTSAREPAPRLLVFEPEHGGHQPAYVRMLADWLAGRQPRDEVIFAVSERLLERLRQEDGFDLERSPGARVALIERNAAECCAAGPLYLRSFRRMRLIRALVRAHPVGHVVVLFLDALQLALAARQVPGGCATLSGILFRPSIHPIYSRADDASGGERLRDARKRQLYRLMLANPALTRVLSLDPYFPAFAASTFRSGGKVVPLPDPVVSLPAATSDAEVGADLREALTTRRVVFTLFGALTERKGVLQALDALVELPAAARDAVRLVLAGWVDPAMAPELARRRTTLDEVDPGGESLRLCDRYLSTAELAWLVRQSSAILAPYQRFVGSSGVLTWAAAAQRPVIAQEYGLVGALVRDYSLGLTIDAGDPKCVAARFIDMLRPERLAGIAAAARWTAFLSGRTAEAFAATVFSDANPGRGP